MEADNTNKNGSRSRAVREWIQVVIILFAAVWGAYEFIVKDVIRPTQEPTALDVVATLEEVGREGGHVLVRARITATNPTKRRIVVSALWFWVKGYKLFFGKSPAKDDLASALI